MIDQGPAGQRRVAPSGGLLAVHAHPDDETLSTGALLATWAASGHPVTVVTCTRGERGEVIAVPGTVTEGLATLEGDGPALAAHREVELAAALSALGVSDHLFLDEVPLADGLPVAGAAGSCPAVPRYEDSGMRWAAPGIAAAAHDSGPAAFARIPVAEAGARLAALIADRRPAVVVSYGPGGGYGHPDHVRAHEVTVRALEVLPASDRPALWCRAVPEPLLREQYRALGRLTAAGVLPGHRPAGDVSGEGMPGDGGPDGRELCLPDPDADPLPPVAVSAADLAGGVAVAVGPVLDRVLASLRAHTTQVQAVTAVPRAAGEPTVAGAYALSNDVWAPLPSHEFYLTFAGSVAPAHPLSVAPSTLGG